MYEGFTEVTDHDCSVAGEGCVGPMEPDGEMIAGGPNGIDTCYGDSGGPGFLQTPDGDFLMGVISRGTWSAGWFCGNGGGTIFVRADSLVPWIEARTGQILERPSCPGQVPPPVQSAALDEEGAVDAAPAGCTATGRSTGNAGWLGVLGVVLLGIRRRARSATAILSA
jgi:secreted trypsin-like serine protease